MKKATYLIVLALFVAFSCVASAINHQGNWRWRNDDGSETTATWKAAENTLTNIQSPSNIRLRIQIFEYASAGASWVAPALNLAYKKSGDLGWTIITNDPTTNHFVLSPSANFADGALTTLQLTPQGEGYNHVPGYMIEHTFPFAKPIMDHPSVSEWEYCIRPTANITRDSYNFQLQELSGDGTAFGVGIVACDVLITTPALTTIQVTNIQNDQSLCVASITDDGSLEIIERGVCWNTIGSPTIADAHSSEPGSFGMSNFTAPLTGLSANTTYYVRSYATNTLGTGYGNEILFTTVPTLGEWGLIAFAGLIALIGAAIVVKKHL